MRRVGHRGRSGRSLAWAILPGIALGAFAAPACHKSGGYTPPVGSPAAPSELMVQQPSTFRFDLSWTDNSTDEDRFILWIDPSEADAVEVELAADLTSWSYTHSAYGSTLHFRVCAENGFGRSRWSNEVSAQTPNPPPPGSGCLLMIEDPGDASDGVAEFAVATASIDAAPTVLARTGFRSDGDDVLLENGPQWYGVRVRGSMVATPGQLRYELDFGVSSSPVPPGTTGESCLCLHQRADGDLAEHYALHGLAGRPIVRSFALGLPFLFGVGQMFPTVVAVDRETQTWSVEVAGIVVAEDLALDAVLTVPSLLVR